MAVKVKPKVQPLGVNPAREPTRQFEIGALNLQGPRGTRLLLESAATEVTLESTIEGASTLTIKVRDYDRIILRSEPVVKMPSNLSLDGVEYSLAKVARSGDEVTLTFEDLAVNILRRYSGARKANRDAMTRAQFARQLVLEPKERLITLVCPELNIKQAIAPPSASPASPPGGEGGT